MRFSKVLSHLCLNCFLERSHAATGKEVAGPRVQDGMAGHECGLRDNG